MCDITEGKSDITLISLKSTDNTLKSTDMRKKQRSTFQARNVRKYNAYIPPLPLIS